MTGTYSAWHFDGKSAVKRWPQIEVVGETFILIDSELRSGPFRFPDLHYRARQGTTDVYGYDGKPGWQLGLKGDVPPHIATRLPRRKMFGSLIDKLGLGRSAVIFAGLSAVVLFVVIRVPQWVAPLVPAAVETQMGDAMIGDFGGRFCRTPAGSKALAKVVQALDADPKDLQVEVANIDMVNAMALPGGKILLFNGLLQQAASPDEVAGVLGHEIGHVRKRHVMQSLLRQLGLSVLLGGFNSNVSGTLNGVLSMSYGREAESDADGFAIDAMQRADISPRATADLFARWARDEKDGDAGKANGMLGYLASHPLSASRRDAFSKAVQKGRGYTPVLTASEWKALKNMCRDDKDVKGNGELFF